MWDKPQQLNLLAALLALAAAGLLLAALFAWAARQPVFAIKRVMVTGQIIEVNPLHLEAVIREALRGTFFTIDLAEAQRAFSQVPWVRQAAVRREWPNRLVVDIDEHRALARWNDSALVNTAGGVFRADYDDELPQLKGPEGSAAEVAARFGQFRDLLAPLALVPQELTLSPRRAWAMKLDNGMVMELGREQVAERLARWVAFYPRSLGRLTRPAEYVDLRYRNGFAARASGLWQEGARAGGARREKRIEGTGR
ncbi:Cell division protein FtsQ [Burkholderiales bacterium]|nr:MAG: FtsQ-type POTRA domain-containing protein [Burkholderiales bacterium]CAG0984818.1 Cell division protein FtsQ [Burkholderiales bacterium]